MTHEVRMCADSGAQLLQESDVTGAAWSEAFFIQQLNDAGRSFGLHQTTDDGVVEVVDTLPLKPGEKQVKQAQFGW